MPPLHNPGGHVPGEVNEDAWVAAERAKRVVQLRRQYKATNGVGGTQELQAAAEDLQKAAEDIAQKRYDEAALVEHTVQESGPVTHDEVVELRLRRLLDRQAKPGTPEFYRQHHVQPPEPYMIAYTPQNAGEGELNVQQLVWGVDCDAWIDTYDIRGVPRFGKHAGEPMTAEEVAALKNAIRPVQFGEDGKPIDWRPAFDSREMPEVEEFVDTGSASVSLEPATPEEREASKQYVTTGYILGGTGDPNVPPTEHVILPDPPNDLGSSGENS